MFFVYNKVIFKLDNAQIQVYLDVMIKLNKIGILGVTSKWLLLIFVGAGKY